MQALVTMCAKDSVCASALVSQRARAGPEQRTAGQPVCDDEEAATCRRHSAKDCPLPASIVLSRASSHLGRHVARGPHKRNLSPDASLQYSPCRAAAACGTTSKQAVVASNSFGATSCSVVDETQRSLQRRSRRELTRDSADGSQGPPGGA
jgi:hypothetical protein